MDNLSVEHIDPRNGVLVSGLENEFNEIIADLPYNSVKTNRFVPYRVGAYPAPINKGDVGEFLIGAEITTNTPGKWTVCEFMVEGGIWWKESNRIGNGSTRGGKKAMKLMPKSILAKNGLESKNLDKLLSHPNTLINRVELGRVNSKLLNSHPNTEATRIKNLAEGQTHPNTHANQVKQSLRKFQCLVTGHISNAGGLTAYQKVRGIETVLRVEIES